MPGYTVYHLFTPEVANAVLHLGVYYLAVFSLYGVIRRLFGKDTALIAALCLGVYTWFLRSAGHDYVDGVGIAYISTALWFATEAVYRTSYKKYLLGCGVFLGGGVALSVVFRHLCACYGCVLFGVELEKPASFVDYQHGVGGRRLGVHHRGVYGF